MSIKSIKMRILPHTVLVVILVISCNDNHNFKQIAARAITYDSSNIYINRTKVDTIRSTISKNPLKLENKYDSIADIFPNMSIAEDDVQVAYQGIIWAWNNHGPCTRFVLCATYIGNFEITFGDGKIGFSKLVQRLTTSAHNCIQNAKNALLGDNHNGINPDRGLAVAWVMASQIHNKPYYEWLKEHGDAVIKALSMVN